MSEVSSMKRLAIGTNDILVAVGLIIVLAFALFATVATGWPGLIYGLIGFVCWAIGSGFWCVLSGIHDELKKSNNKG